MKYSNFTLFSFSLLSYVGSNLRNCSGVPAVLCSLKSKEFYQPWESMPSLYEAVQMRGVFSDSKVFSDALPRSSISEINSAFLAESAQTGFNISDFTARFFILPSEDEESSDEIHSKDSMVDHLHSLWPHLTRSADDSKQHSTLIPLPNKYVVPGGRFREIYYWDSFFTMIGLRVSGEKNLIKSLIDNFTFQIDRLGYIPNGNRVYYLGRSQPPFYGAMLNLYHEFTSDEEILKYLPALRKEYDFWMLGNRAVQLEYGVLNRYWDENDTPRPESYKEDIELAEHLPKAQRADLYRNIRAAAESGWDFSARWFAHADNFTSIQTTSILPVDLNAILYNTENILAKFYSIQGDDKLAVDFLYRAQARRETMHRYLWNAEKKMFMDFHIPTNSFTGRVTAASFVPMYFGVASQEQAEAQVPAILKELLVEGGLMTSNIESGQQWDAPNGWAPLQWMAVNGLKKYGFEAEGKEISERWLALNERVFKSTGKMMEKYNVAGAGSEGGGGEYPNQDGFGWTNGVALGLLEQWKS